MSTNFINNAFFKTISVLLIVTMASLYSPAYAAYHDNSGDLPGMSSDSEVKGAVTAIIIVTVVCITAMIIPAVIIAKKKKARAQAAAGNANGTGNTSSSVRKSDTKENE